MLYFKLTPTAGSDFIPLTVLLTFNAATPNRNVNVTIINDDIPEDLEFFSLSLTSDVPEATIFPAFASVRISDFDRPPRICKY